jgi:hypothetical protein
MFEDKLAGVFSGLLGIIKLGNHDKWSKKIYRPSLEVPHARVVAPSRAEEKEKRLCTAIKYLNLRRNISRD